MRSGSLPDEGTVKLVSIVIPVYNSDVLEELSDRIGAVFDSRSEDYEIIFVDDSSPNPATWKELEQLASQREEVKAIQLTRGFGQQAATLCGLQASRGDPVLTMDDDLQHLPEDLPRFLDQRDKDILIGQFDLRHHNLFKRVTSWMKSIFDRIIIKKPKHLRLTSYRMLNRMVVDGVLATATPNPFIPALMFHVSRDAMGVPVRHQPRKSGQSGYTLRARARINSYIEA